VSFPFFDTLKVLRKQIRIYATLYNEHFDDALRGEMLFAAFDRLSRDRTAFEPNAATINSLMFNQLRGVSAFAPVFSEVYELLTTSPRGSWVILREDVCQGMTSVVPKSPCFRVDFETIIPPAASYTATGGIGVPRTALEAI
jgi:hypothetical protein